MTGKPATAIQYDCAHTARVKSALLFIATRLGDMMDDIIVVGGLVPTLIINQSNSMPGVEPHAGTMDLDLGLKLAVLESGRYREISARLRDAGFRPDRNERGHQTNHRWVLSGTPEISLDFLISPSCSSDVPGRLKNIESDFAAVVASGLECAFHDRMSVNIRCHTIQHEAASRNLWACGPGGFIVMKALAFEGRGENKDAYDLNYVLGNFGAGIDEVACHLRRLLDHHDARKAISILERDFCRHDAPGPVRAALFLTGKADEVVCAEVSTNVRTLLALLKK